MANENQPNFITVDTNSLDFSKLEGFDKLTETEQQEIKQHEQYIKDQGSVDRLSAAVVMRQIQNAIEAKRSAALADSVELEKENKKKIEDSRAEIKAGITNEAAKKHVTKLAGELRDLKMQNAKQHLQIKMLQKNSDVGLQELSTELEQLKGYMVGFNGVVDTFVERMEQKINFRQSGVNESRQDETGTTGSN